MSQPIHLRIAKYFWSSLPGSKNEQFTNSRIHEFSGKIRPCHCSSFIIVYLCAKNQKNPQSRSLGKLTPNQPTNQPTTPDIAHLKVRTTPDIAHLKVRIVLYLFHVMLILFWYILSIVVFTLKKIFPNSSFKREKRSNLKYFLKLYGEILNQIRHPAKMDLPKPQQTVLIPHI